MPPEDATSSVLPSKTVFAAESGVPRFQSFTIRGYPESVSEPGPKSVPTQSVSCRATPGSTWPPAARSRLSTKSFVFVSNSRRTAASEPPTESVIMQRS